MNMDERRLTILQLEDSPLDQRLVAEALSEDGLMCEFVYAKTRAEFETELQKREYDLILSDYSLPEYNGNAALRLARQLRPETPFLFVSGTMGETQVVESLKSGATDYVLKHHLERLGAAVRRALREAEERAERKRTEEALRVAQQRLGHLLAKSPAIIYALKIDANSPALAWVTENVELLGFTVEEACESG
jgi:sigma-B regulation protein RsbU (phosphoserine phosphatase)